LIAVSQLYLVADFENEKLIIKNKNMIENDINKKPPLLIASVSGSDIFKAVDEAMSLIDYLHQLTVIPDNMVEDYANRFANTMNLLAEIRHHYR
jgi:hypothetical protein